MTNLQGSECRGVRRGLKCPTTWQSKANAALGGAEGTPASGTCHDPRGRPRKADTVSKLRDRQAEFAPLPRAGKGAAPGRKARPGGLARDWRFAAARNLAAGDRPADRLSSSARQLELELGVQLPDLAHDPLETLLVLGGRRLLPRRVELEQL